MNNYSSTRLLKSKAKTKNPRNWNWKPCDFTCWPSNFRRRTKLRTRYLSPHFYLLIF